MAGAHGHRPSGPAAAAGPEPTPSGLVFLDRVRRLTTELQQHATSEEADQFPRLRVHIPEDRLLEMANKVQSAKRLAPTRPHPHTPHVELLHKTIGSGAGMIDRLRESLIGRSVD